MLAAELAALASTSAVTLVAAMTTDAWEGVRAGVLRLFARGGEAKRQAAEIQLDSNAELMAGSDDKDRARLSLVSLWTMEMEQFLGSHPAAADDLRALIEGARAVLPPPQQLWVMTVTSQGGGLSVGVQGGSVVMHGVSPRPAVSPAEGPGAQPEGQP